MGFMMAYSVDLRQGVVQYVEEGNTKKSAVKLFNVSLSTIQSWIRLKQETGALKCRPYTGGARAKVSQAEAYIKANPSQTLHEIGAHFGLTHGWAEYNLKKYGYVHKKNIKIHRKR